MKSLLLVVASLALSPLEFAATQPPPAAAQPGMATAPIITYVPGSTAKLEQLIGDEDKERHPPTLSRTGARCGVEGTDFGYSFEHQGRAYFLFGDTLGRLERALDTIATTDARDPEQGVRLDFLTFGSDYLTIQPPGISMGAFEVPVSDISLGGQMYVVVSTNHSTDRTTDRSVLTKFTSPSTFQPLRTIRRGGRGASRRLCSMPRVTAPSASSSTILVRNQTTGSQGRSSARAGRTRVPSTVAPTPRTSSSAGRNFRAPNWISSMSCRPGIPTSSS
jgi:hypothetical protein